MSNTFITKYTVGINPGVDQIKGCQNQLIDKKIYHTAGFAVATDQPAAHTDEAIAAQTATFLQNS